MSCHLQNSAYTEYDGVALTTVPIPGLRSAHPRDRDRIALAKRVVARLEVRLAPGEPNGILQITRSVICVNQSRTRSVLDLSMREQSLSTVVQKICRAFDQTSHNTNCEH